MCNSARRSTSATGRLLYAPAHPELVDALLAACVEWDYARWTAGQAGRLPPGAVLPAPPGRRVADWLGDPLNGAPPDLALLRWRLGAA